MLNTTFILRNGSMEHNGLFACSQVKVCGQNCQVYIFLFLQYLHKGKILTNQLKGHYSHSLVTSDSFLFQLSEEGHKLLYHSRLAGTGTGSCICFLYAYTLGLCSEVSLSL